MVVHVDAFTAPQPFHPTPVKDDDEEKNQPTLRQNDQKEAEEETTQTNLAWRPANSRLWFAQAAALKARGTAIYTSKIPGDSSAAFACYSRALQLVTLLSASIGLSTKGEESEEEKVPCEVMFGRVEEGYVDLDAETPCPIDADQVDLDPGTIEKMHFR